MAEPRGGQGEGWEGRQLPLVSDWKGCCSPRVDEPGGGRQSPENPHHQSDFTTAGPVGQPPRRRVRVWDSSPPSLAGVPAPLLPPLPACDGRPLVIALMGPTASGKTALAIELAEVLDLAVLSIDSRQLYQEMDVGTAKPTAQQRRRVRHELLDLRPPDRPITLQEFTRHALAAIDAEHRRRGVALLVGGTGLYLQALLEGLQPPAVAPQPHLRQQFAALGQVHCRQLLSQVDPGAAARILPGDAVRTQRALEVYYATGRPLSSQQRRSPPPWRILELGLDAPDLGERIRSRTQDLYREGLVEETERLAARYGADCPLLQTIGYGEALRLLAGDWEEAEARTITERRTRQYAKRQRTWFRRQHRPHWLPAPAGVGGAAGPTAGAGSRGAQGAEVPTVAGLAATLAGELSGALPAGEVVATEADLLRWAVPAALQGLG